MAGRVRPLGIPGVALIEATGFSDDRGGFFEYLRAEEFLLATGSGLTVAQVNCSVSVRGALRGIAVTGVPPGQAKVVVCLAGEVLDVAVDLRVGSPTFGAWHAERLGETRRAALLLPPGVGHAFMAIADSSSVVYLLSASHDPALERRVHPLDPDIGIEWSSGTTAVMSAKDASAPGLRQALEAGLLPDYSACLAAGQQEAR
jgi:dTDP-4-dehydrorhamnose 3,5-epimerase